MARVNKTFRPEEDVATALQKRATKENLSESEVVNKALRCYLGLGVMEDCETSNKALKNLEKKFELKLKQLIKLNNLVEPA